MKNKLAHIVVSDKGWILERLAESISSRIPSVTYSTQPDPTALIQYYITYGARKERVSPIEVALFTHLEADESAAKKFFDCAQSVDHCVAMSNATQRIMTDKNINNVSVIMPGVDLDRFNVLVKIAVVGRTYHTGRKGEALVNAVLDVPGIEWHFTGDGWPVTNEHIPEEDLPSFYRSMDYILVPATNEGGPMSVLEALASGVQVIASDVGWVNEFPHIAFEKNNPKSLRNVLEQVVTERQTLRSSVIELTWDQWAEKHRVLFEDLAKLGENNFPGTEFKFSVVKSALLATHGAEDTTLGGPSVRVPRTAKGLAELGINAKVINNGSAISKEEAGVIHCFNAWHPSSALKVLRRARSLDIPMVFSPIMLDLSEGSLWQRDLLIAFRAAVNGDEAERLMKGARRKFLRRNEGKVRQQPEPSLKDALKEMAELSDAMIFLSDFERKLFQDTTGYKQLNSFLVRNPVDVELFQNADPVLFKEKYGLNDYVICVARVEHRKNQLMLAAALRDMDIPLVLIGHVADKEYFDLINKFSGPNLLHIDRLEPGSDLLISAIAGAKVFVLPSWCEGGPLAALEAASCGVRMVLSDRSGEYEYFGDRALYCDPSDMESIRECVTQALSDDWDEVNRSELVQHVRDNYSYRRYISDTASAYEAAYTKHNRILAPESALQEIDNSNIKQIIFDLTTYANNSAFISGIVRVERAIALQLQKIEDTSVVFVAWVTQAIGFVVIPREVVLGGVISSYINYLRINLTRSDEKINLKSGGNLVIVGSSWMQNSAYLSRVRQFANLHSLKISMMMHDMTPSLFPEWFPEGYSKPWCSNCAEAISFCDQLIVYSESTRRDVTAFANSNDIRVPSFAKVRLADEIGIFSDGENYEVSSRLQRWRNKPFVIAIGSIHPRKNYQLLIDVWAALQEDMKDACPDLLIVGSVAWGGTDVARTIKENPRVNKCIHLLSNIEDGDLDWLYKNSLLTVYPSLYEGWGLPIGESLANGKICIASKLSSMLEIAPDLTDLIDPLDRRQWVARVKHYALSSTSRSAREKQIKENYRTTSWENTTLDLINGLKIANKIDSIFNYNLGQLVMVRDREMSSKFLSSGWHDIESWGVWAGTNRPEIFLKLVHQPEEDLVFSIYGQVFNSRAVSSSYDVYVNDVRVGGWGFGASSNKNENHFPYVVSRVLVPKQLVLADRVVRIQFVTGSVQVAKDVLGGEDTRSIGLGIVAFMLCDQTSDLDFCEYISTLPTVRGVLKLADNTNIKLLSSTSTVRRSWPLDVWLRPGDPATQWVFANQKLIDGFKVISHGGTLQFSGGLGRFNFSKPLLLKLILAFPNAKLSSPQVVQIFINDLYVTSLTVNSSAIMEYDFEIDPATLAINDPAKVIVSIDPNSEFKRDHVGAKGDFFLYGIRWVSTEIISSPLALKQEVNFSRLPHKRNAEFFGDWLLDQGGSAHMLSPSGAIEVNLENIINNVGSICLQMIASRKLNDAVHKLVVSLNGSILPSFDYSESDEFEIDAKSHFFIDLSSINIVDPDRTQINFLFENNSLAYHESVKEDGADYSFSVNSISLRKFLPFSINDAVKILNAPIDNVVFGCGWSDPEDVGRWTNKSRADLFLALPKLSEGEVEVELEVEGFFGNRDFNVKKPRFTVNNIPVYASISSNSGNGYFIRIRLPEVDSGYVNLGIFMDTLISPVEFNLGNDNRSLGLRLLAIKFLEHGVLGLGESLDIGFEFSNKLVFGSGWSGLEEDGRWGIDNCSEIYLALPKLGVGEAQLELVVDGFWDFPDLGVTPPKVSVNGEQISVSYFKKLEIGYCICIPIPEIFAGFALVEIFSDKLLTPLCSGLGQDDRTLGIKLSSLRLSDYRLLDMISDGGNDSIMDSNSNETPTKLVSQNQLDNSTDSRNRTKRKQRIKR